MQKKAFLILIDSITEFHALNVKLTHRQLRVTYLKLLTVALYILHKNKSHL